MRPFRERLRIRRPIDSDGGKAALSKRPREAWWFLGPAFVASVAYMDPGNFATNIEGGARFGYQLLWVLLWSNAMAILVQYLAAKLGIATGQTLPENCRAEFSQPVTLGLVDRGGNRGDGHRPCRISGRGSRVLSPFWHSECCPRRC